MNLMKKIWQYLGELWAECRTRETLAILLVTVILVTRHALGTGPGAQALAPLWEWLAASLPLMKHGLLQRQVIAIVLQLCVPLLIIVVVHRQRLRDYGLGLGDRRFWLPLTALIFAIQIVVVVLYLSNDPAYVRRYPSLDEARQGGAVFWIWEASRVLYMLSWEFLFRGYLLFALAPRLGLLSCAVQTVPFTLMHIVSAKPISEVYFTIASGLLSGVLSLKSRSVWPVVWLHAAGAVLLDIMLVYGK